MASRDLESARQAYLIGDVEQSKTAHANKKTTEKHKTSGEFIKSAVYGGVDGILTIFAIACGAIGSDMPPAVTLVLGLCSLLGDGLSMAIGDYMSTKAEIEFQNAEREREEWEVDNNPEGEKIEMQEIYVEKGMSVEDAKLVVDTLSKNKKTWVDIMMVEELGLLNGDDSPLKNGLVTFFSFVVLGFIPLIPYVLSSAITMNNMSHMELFEISLGLTAAAMFALGALKTKVTGKNWLISGVEVLFLGTIAAGVAYLVGVLFQPLAGNAFL